jgi:hypothetical protein
MRHTGKLCHSFCRHAENGALTVEMQAASLFAFGVAKGVPVGVLAHVTNAIAPPRNSSTKVDPSSDTKYSRLSVELADAPYAELKGACLHLG